MLQGLKPMTRFEVFSDPDLLLPYSEKRNFMSNPQDIYTALVHDP